MTDQTTGVPPSGARTHTALSEDILDDADRDELVEANLYVVRWVMGKLALRLPAHADWDDLWAAGLLGLVDASRRYDPARGVPFAAYASRRVRGAILDAARSVDWASRGLRRDVREMNAAAERIEQDRGTAATDEEIADAVGMDVDRVRRRRQQARVVSLLPLEDPVSSGVDAITRASLLAEGLHDTLPHAAFERGELVGTLITAVAHLPSAPREVLVRHYVHDETLREIASSLGVTEGRVSQLHIEGLHALRAFLATRFDAVPDVPRSAPGAKRRAAYVAALADAAPTAGTAESWTPGPHR